MTSKFFAEDGEQSDHASNEEVSDVEEEKKQQTKKSDKLLFRIQ